MANNYTLARGELWFDRFAPNAIIGNGERHIGNTTEVNFTMESETLDHYNMDRGVREKDESITLQVNRTGSFVTDNISSENLALFLFGETSTFSVSSGAVTGEAFNDVILGLTYQLGMSQSNPSGVRGVTSVVVKKASTTLVLGTDYTLDATMGRVTLLTTSSTLVSGDDITVDYTKTAQTRERVVSGTTSVAGALRFISFNPQGLQRDWYLPYVKISPNGDFALKSDEWQSIPFNVEVLKRSDRDAAFYIDGRPTA